MEPKEEYLYDHIRKHSNPRPQEKGLYKQDYKGFYLYLDEIFSRGLPNSYSYLTKLSVEYNIPIPLQKKYINEEYSSFGTNIDYIEATNRSI